MDFDPKKYPNKLGSDDCTDLQVMKSAAGFYLGRSYFDNEFKLPMPYSRESDYFDTEADATRALTQGFEVRQADENAHLPEPHQPYHN